MASPALWGDSPKLKDFGRIAARADNPDPHGIFAMRPTSALPNRPSFMNRNRKRSRRPNTAKGTGQVASGKPLSESASRKGKKTPNSTDSGSAVEKEMAKKNSTKKKKKKKTKKKAAKKDTQAYFSETQPQSEKIPCVVADERIPPAIVAQHVRALSLKDIGRAQSYITQAEQKQRGASARILKLPREEQQKTARKTKPSRERAMFQSPYFKQSKKDLGSPRSAKTGQATYFSKNRVDLEFISSQLERDAKRKLGAGKPRGNRAARSVIE